MDEVNGSAKPEAVLPQSSFLHPASDPRSPLQTVFLRGEELRPIWRLLLYAAAYYGLESLFLSLTEQAWSSRSHPLWFFVVTEGERLLAAVIPALVLSRFENRSFGAYGLMGRNAFGGLFWTGVVWGLLSISLLLLALRAMGVFYFGGFALDAARVVKFSVFWAAGFLLVAGFEEFLFRGYSQFTLAQAISFWPAALVLSTLFGALHLTNQGEAGIGALAAALIGLFWCFTLRRTGSLWFAVGMHAAWNWAETFLYSVPNSGMVGPGHLLKSSFHGSRWLTGGSVGPEGSVLVFALLALLWVLFDRLHPPKST